MIQIKLVKYADGVCLAGFIFKRSVALDATDKECIAAAKLANADSLPRRLPEGYRTVWTLP